jgi:hypothetical protein
VGGRDVADVDHVEAQQRAELRLAEQRRDAGEALIAQPVESHPLLPVDRHRAVALQPHVALLSAIDCTIIAAAFLTGWGGGARILQTIAAARENV